MAGNERTLVLKLVADVDKAARGIEGIESKLGGFGKAIGILAGFAIVDKAAGAIIDFGKDAVSAASSIEESSARLDTVLGNSAATVERFAATSAEAYGLSKQAALDYGGQLGTLFSALGQTDQAAAASSTQFLALAADMASFNNVPVDDALTALQAGLRGESEPLRRFGVLLDDATLRGEAMALGIVKTTKDALTPQQKALAAQSVILKQTAKQQGDVARTSGGLANSQKRLEAELANVTAEIGAELLPIMTTLVRWAVANLLPMIRKAWDLFKKFAAIVGPILVPFLEELFAAISEVWRALAPLVKELLPPLLRLLGEFAKRVLPIIGTGFRAMATAIRIVVDAIRSLVRWTKEALRFVGDLLNKIPKIEIPNISLPFSSSRTAAAVAGVSAGTRAAGSRAAPAGVVNVNIYGGDPAAIRATVLEALRGYSRQNGSAQLLPTW